MKGKKILVFALLMLLALPLALAGCDDKSGADNQGGNAFTATTTRPESFNDGQETPTIYKLNFTDGTQKLICISGRPSWPGGGPGEGFDASISSSLDENGGCNGLVWSEYENFFGPNATRDEYVRTAGAEYYDAVVAGSSLTQIKDENGNFIDKWMMTYHDDRQFYVMKTYLTFNEEGQMEWTEPVRLLGQNDEYRSYERVRQFCEVEILRSPDGKELAALFRANAKKSLSYVSFSTDEGETWSEPKTVAAELTGERHKAEYDPVTGKLTITFRSIYYNGEPSNGNWYSKGWLAWVGDYEDLKAGSEGKGDMLIKLAHTYGSATEASEEANADTGYAGLVIYDDGLVVTCSYGTFSPANDPTHGNQTYIVAKRFSLADLLEKFEGTYFVDISPSSESNDSSEIYSEFVVADKSTTDLTYIAHPDSVLLDNGNIITAFSLGHGTGGTQMAISIDKGKTWSPLFMD